MKWTFEQLKTIPKVVLSEGYQTLTIIDGEAEIDLADVELVEYAKRQGGQPETPKKKVSKSDGN